MMANPTNRGARRATMYAGLLMAALIACTSPTDTEKRRATELTLYLERPGTFEATYSGEPIVAYLSMKDSVPYRSIAWHGGMGLNQRPRNLSDSHFIANIDEKVKRLSVEFIWRAPPKNKDTADGKTRYYDTIYASTGGELRVSNVVKVYVTNIPPVIDSVYIGGKAYGPLDTIVSYEMSIKDTIPLAVKVLDYDDNTTNVVWSGGTRGKLIADNQSQAKKTATYIAARKNYSDTILVKMYDDGGGQTFRRLVLIRQGYGSPPVIDSIRIGAKSYVDSAGALRYGSFAIDSLALRIFAHDADSDSVAYSWSAGRGSLIYKGKDSVQYERIYLPRDSITRVSRRDTFAIVDTIRIRVTDPLKKADTVLIQLYQGRINRLPVFDSVKVSRGARDTTVRGNDTSFVLSSAKAQRVRIRAYAHDPDSLDTLTFRWYSSYDTLVARSSARSDTLAFTTADTTYVDTVRVIATDKMRASAVDTLRIPVK